SGDTGGCCCAAAVFGAAASKAAAIANPAIWERLIALILASVLAPSPGLSIDLSEQPCRDSMIAESGSPAFLVMGCGRAVARRRQPSNIASRLWNPTCGWRRGGGRPFRRRHQA